MHLIEGRKSVRGARDSECCSFNGNKILSQVAAACLSRITNSGCSAPGYLTTQAKDDPVEYVHHEIGYNYRLTNVQAAMGCAQMELLDEYVEAKRRIAARYTEAFAGVAGLTPMSEAPWARSTFWMFTTLVDGASFGLSPGAVKALAHTEDPDPPAVATVACFSSASPGRAGMPGGGTVVRSRAFAPVLGRFAS